MSKDPRPSEATSINTFNAEESFLDYVTSGNYQPGRTEIASSPNGQSQEICQEKKTGKKRTKDYEKLDQNATSNEKEATRGRKKKCYEKGEEKTEQKSICQKQSPSRAGPEQPQTPIKSRDVSPTTSLGPDCWKYEILRIQYQQLRHNYAHLRRRYVDSLSKQQPGAMKTKKGKQTKRNRNKKEEEEERFFLQQTLPL